VLYIVLTTPICNLNCRYCGGTINGMPSEIKYKLDTLVKLIDKDPEAVVAFYGGEPLLEIDMIKKLLDILPAKHFVLNTNGFFLKDLNSYIHKFDTILLSIDGDKEITDFYRGKGCYQKVIEALDFLRYNSYKGEVIARMTVSKKSDIYRDVTHLLEFFPFVHWQLDAVWSSLWNLSEFSRWSEESYKPGIISLLDLWLENIREDKVLGIIPFVGIVSRILYNESGLPCGAGENAFAITTDGRVLACPIAPDFQWNNLGDLHSFSRVSNKIEPCIYCEVFDICGGRCLFAQRERLWGEEGFKAICDITKFLIKELDKHIDELRHLKNKIRYPPFNNTTEIIP